MAQRQTNMRPRTRQIAVMPDLVDIINNSGKSKFLFHDGRVVESLQQGGELLRPPGRDSLSCLPPRLKEIKCYLNALETENLTAEDIFETIAEGLKEYSRLPTEDYYYLLAAWVMHTYRLDWQTYSPIIFLFGVAERGKSRTGKALAYCSYRGIVTETLNPAPLFRLAEAAEPTLFIDVVNLKKKAEKQDTLDILNARYERGARVQRVVRPEERGLDAIGSFHIFGPTIIGTNVIPEERLLTRGFLIVMPEAEGHFREPKKRAPAIYVRWLALNQASGLPRRSKG